MGVCIYSVIRSQSYRTTFCAFGSISVYGAGPGGILIIQLDSAGACQSVVGRSLYPTAVPVSEANWIASSTGCCSCFGFGDCEEGTPNDMTLCCGPGAQALEHCQSYSACVAQLSDASCTYSRCCCGPPENRVCKYVNGLNCQTEADMTCLASNPAGITSPGGTRYACPPCTGPNTSTYSCTETPCVGGSGCCLCDRCCDGLTSTQCNALGGQVLTQSCNTPAGQAACKAANIKPKCIRAAWRLGIRPNAHYANMTRGVAPHRMSLFSKQTTKDLPSGECKTYYGWTQKHATRGMMHGAICNQFNQRCANTRTVRKLKLVRHPSKGMMRFETKYRKPCPEVSDMGCGVMTSGCPGT